MSAPQTLADTLTFDGIGLHTGAAVTMRLHPAEDGVVFVRGKERLPARCENVSATSLGTTLRGAFEVATVEHLMAALWGCGVDAVEVEIDGPEVPAMDGSAAPYCAAIAAVGLEALPGERRVRRPRGSIVVERGASRLELHPADALEIDLEIAFDHPAVGTQRLVWSGDFASELAWARTFGFEADVAAMQVAGKALGGSFDNAIVIGETGVLNPGGLRAPDELVRHKALDLLGDLYLGGRLHARVVARRPGHALHITALRALTAGA